MLGRIPIVFGDKIVHKGYVFQTKWFLKDIFNKIGKIKNV